MAFFFSITASIFRSMEAGCVTTEGLADALLCAPLFWLDWAAALGLLFVPEQPFRSSTKVNASTAVAAAVAADPIKRARFVEPLFTGLEWKDFILFTSAALAALLHMARKRPFVKLLIMRELERDEICL